MWSNIFPFFTYQNHVLNDKLWCVSQVSRRQFQGQRCRQVTCRTNPLHFRPNSPKNMSGHRNRIVQPNSLCKSQHPSSKTLIMYKQKSSNNKHAENKHISLTRTQLVYARANNICSNARSKWIDPASCLCHSNTRNI